MLFQVETMRKLYLVVCGHKDTKIVVVFISSRLVLHPRMCQIPCQLVDLSLCRKTFLPNAPFRLQSQDSILSSVFRPSFPFSNPSCQLQEHSRALLALFESVIKGGSEGLHGQQAPHTRVNLI